MGDLLEFDDKNATPNERMLYAAMGDRRRELVDMREILLNDLAAIRKALDTRIDAQNTTIAELTEAVGGQDALITKLTETLGTNLHVDASFLKKLNEFFGPMLEGKNPPLDGNQIATKDYVDKAIERIAAAIRQQIAQAIELTNGLVRQVAKSQTVGGVLDVITAMVSRDVARAQAEEEAARRPDRMKSLFHALTGRTPK